MPAFTVFLAQDTGEPIPSASVAVFDDAGSPLMSVLTDVDGAALLASVDASVILVISKSGFSFNNRYYLEVEDGDVFDIDGTALHVAPPEDASKCRVYGRILDPLSRALSERWKFNLKIVDQIGSDVDDDIISSTAKVSHDDGFIVMDLLRGAQYELGPMPLSYTAAKNDAEYDELSLVSFTVPDNQTARLVDLISPRVTQVSVDLDSIRTILREPATYDVVVTLTDGQTAKTPSEYIAIISSDPSVATATISGSTLTISFESVGTCTITLISQRSRSTAESMFYRPAPQTALKVIDVEVV